MPASTDTGVPLSQRCTFGIFVPPSSGNPVNAAYHEAETLLGVRSPIAGVFCSFDTSWAGHNLEWADFASGGTPRTLVVAWMPDKTTGTVTLSQIPTGTYDTHINQMVAGMAAYPGQVIVRFGHEMNGNWYPWSVAYTGTDKGISTAADYVAASRYIHDKLAAADPSIKTMFCANGVDVGATTAEAYYPGDAYVDLLALDSYNTYAANPATGWTSPYATFQPMYDRLEALSGGKDIWVAETGCMDGVTGRSKATWLTDLFTETRLAKLKGVVYFDSQGGKDWRFQTSTTAAEAASAGYRSVGDADLPDDMEPPVDVARHLFGRGPGDFAVTLTGTTPVLLPNTAGTVWTAEAGGIALTDLLDAAGAAATGVTSGPDGRVAFWGPPGVTSAWVDFGYGRFAMNTSEAPPAYGNGDYAAVVPRPLHVDARDHGAFGNIPDATAALDAARVAAGPNGTIRVPAGVHIVTTLALSTAGQRWELAPGATIKAKAGTATSAVVDITADGVTWTGGTIDGNRASLTGGTDGTNAFGFKVVGADQTRIEQVTIRDTLDQAIHIGNANGLHVADTAITNCGRAGNRKAITVWYEGNSSDLWFERVKIDGTTSQNGGICVTLAAAVTVTGVHVIDPDITVGAKSDDDTLGVEFFTALTSGATVQNWTVKGGSITGTGARCFGISTTGVTNNATKGTKRGVISGVRIDGCQQTPIEIIASDVAVTGCRGTGNGPVYINAVQVTGGISGVAMSGNVFRGGVSYALALLGGTNGIRDLNLTGNVLEGTAVRFNGYLNGDLADNTFRLTVGGFDFESTATAAPGANPQDLRICGGTINVSDTSHDGIVLAYTGTGRLTLEGLRIRGGRHGIYFLNAADNVTMRGLDVRGAAQHGIYVAATGCDALNLFSSVIEDNGGWGVIWGNATNVTTSGNRVRGNPSGQVSNGTATFVTTV